MWKDEHDPAAYRPPEVEPAEPDPHATRESLLARLRVTPEECAAIRTAEQRSELWFRARTGRLTASNFGAAACLNKHCTRRELNLDQAKHCTPLKTQRVVRNVRRRGERQSRNVSLDLL